MMEEEGEVVEVKEKTVLKEEAVYSVLRFRQEIRLFVLFLELQIFWS